MQKDFSGLQVQYLPTGDLTPDPRNPRTHSRRQRRMLAASLREFGFVNPILIDRKKQIVAGHGRWEAAKAEGYAQVPTIRLEHLTDKQRRAYIIADNKLAQQAGWDREMLVLELGALIELDCSLEAIGFRPAEIQILNCDILGAKAAPKDPWPPTAGAPITHPGDLWLLRKHRILSGDARRPSDYARLMNGKSAAAVVFADLRRHRRDRSDAWTYPTVSGVGPGRGEARAKLPTVKTIALVADAMRDCTAEGDLVLDPFLGAGTTILAAEKIGRIVFGLEIEPACVDVSIRRWQASTKLDAILEGDGRTFDEIAAERMKADQPGPQTSSTQDPPKRGLVDAQEPVASACHAAAVPENGGR